MGGMTTCYTPLAGENEPAPYKESKLSKGLIVAGAFVSAAATLWFLINADFSGVPRPRRRRFG